MQPPLSLGKRFIIQQAPPVLVLIQNNNSLTTKSSKNLPTSPPNHPKIFHFHRRIIQKSFIYYRTLDSRELIPHYRQAMNALRLLPDFHKNQISRNRNYSPIIEFPQISTPNAFFASTAPAEFPTGIQGQIPGSVDSRRNLRLLQCSISFLRNKLKFSEKTLFLGLTSGEKMTMIFGFLWSHYCCFSRTETSGIFQINYILSCTRRIRRVWLPNSIVRQAPSGNQWFSLTGNQVISCKCVPNELEMPATPTKRGSKSQDRRDFRTGNEHK